MRAAAEAALADGAVDLLQAEALVILAESLEDPALQTAALLTVGGDLSDATRDLSRHCETAAARLEDEEAGTPMDELATMLARLRHDVHHLVDTTVAPSRPSPAATPYASERWRLAVVAAQRHLRAAADMLDDGEPADAVAFQVIAARDALVASLRKKL
jgi:tRNA U34 5-carboxymethylaminomethyl modifying GTPase MnmE/TrmE